MIVADIYKRRNHLAAVRLLPPPEPFENAQFDENGCMLVDREILLRCEIKKGTQLSAEDLKDLAVVSECYRAKERAVWYLSQGDLSRSGLYKKLKQKFSSKACDFAVDQMVKRGYVNDNAFAERLANKFRQNGLSKRAAMSKMIEKGIPPEIAKHAVQEFNCDESETVLRLLQTKYKNKISDTDDLRRTTAALARRGFSYSDIKSALSLLKIEQ